MGILKMLGLMTVEEYAKVEKARNTALTDLASAVEAKVRLSDESIVLNRNATLDRNTIETQAKKIGELTAELAAADNLAAGYRADAEAMRAKRQRDRDLKAGKAKSAPTVSAPKPVAAKVKKSPRKAA